MRWGVALALVALAAAPGAAARFGSGSSRAAENPALVSLASVSNGCGGGLASKERAWGDSSTYSAYNETERQWRTLRVNFRDACNLHDAAYSGAVVRDDLNGGTVTDFRTWTQKEIDEKFLRDMWKLCERQIPAWAHEALRSCKGHGDSIGEGPSFGAESRYDFVRSNGYRFFRKRANLNGRWGRWSGVSMTASIKQSGRSISVSWLDRGTGKCGEFHGLLVTRDQDELVDGVTTIAGQSGKHDGYFTVRPGNQHDFVLSWHGPPGAAELVRAQRASNGVDRPRGAEAKCAAPSSKPETSTTPTTGGATFTLMPNPKVVNPNGPEVIINTAAGTATWDHTGQYGGAGKGGEWKIEYTFKVPTSLTAGKAASISLSLKAVLVEPSQPLFVQMSARAPDFRQDLSINYPSPAQAAKTYSVPISTGYATAKDLYVIVNFVSAEITFTYHRAGS